MKTKLLATLLIFVFLVSCGNQGINFSNDKNLNKIINNFYKGKFYQCDYEKSFSSGLDSIPKGFTSTPKKFLNSYRVTQDSDPSRELIIVTSKKRIGVLFQKPIKRWFGRTKMIFKKEKDNTYIWKDWIDFEGVLTSHESVSNSFPLRFDGQTLAINEAKTYFTNFYHCVLLKPSNLEKETIAREFLSR